MVAADILGLKVGAEKEEIENGKCPEFVTIPPPPPETSLDSAVGFLLLCWALLPLLVYILLVCFFCCFPPVRLC